MRARGGRWVSGYVRVNVESPSADRLNAFVRELYRRGVLLSHLQVRETTCSFITRLDDIDALRDVRRRCPVKVRFGNRSGLSILAERAWRRKSFFIGVALFIVILDALGSLVWRVDISGVTGDTASTLLQSAEDVGIRPLAWRPALPPPTTLQDELLRTMPNLLWVGVHLDGGVAKIDAIEKVKGVTPPNLSPQNIVASKTGVILKVFATRGDVLVKKGQVVSPGQVIISGSLADGAVHVAASGEAMAEVWYTSKVVVPLKANRSVLTGRYVTRSYLDIGSTHLRVWGWQQPKYSHQIDQSHQYQWHIGKINLPFGWQDVRVYEAGTTTYQQSIQAASLRAQELSSQDVVTRGGRNSRVLSQTVLQQNVERGNLYATVLTRLEEDIGVAEPLPESPPTQTVPPTD